MYPMKFKGYIPPPLYPDIYEIISFFQIKIFKHDYFQLTTLGPLELKSRPLGVQTSLVKIPYSKGRG